MRFSKKKILNMNIMFIIAIVLMFFAAIYFLFRQQRSQATVFVSLVVQRNTNLNINAPNAWIPYWLDNSILIGDVEMDLYGHQIAQIIEKKSYETVYSGRNVYVILKINASRSKSGSYLYKNKPLAPGSLIEFKFINSQFAGFINTISNEKPAEKYKTIQVSVLAKDIDPWLANAFKLNSEIKTNDLTIAKILKIDIKPSEKNTFNQMGQSTITYDKIKKDLILDLEILVNENHGQLYFMETQKIKILEIVYLPFKEISMNMVVKDIKLD